MSHGVKPVNRGSQTEVRNFEAYRGNIMSEKLDGNYSELEAYALSKYFLWKPVLIQGMIQ